MLFAETSADLSSPWWVTILSILVTGGGLKILFDYQLQKITKASEIELQKQAATYKIQRDAVGDYQLLVDKAEAIRDKVELSREKLVGDLAATSADNLVCKAGIAKLTTENVELMAKVAEQDRRIAQYALQVKDLTEQNESLKKQVASPK